MRPGLRRFLIRATGTTGVIVGLGAGLLLSAAPQHARFREEPGPYPSDWFGMQRAFPFESIDQEAYDRAIEYARVERAALGLEPGSGPSLSAGLVWSPAGPYNIGGRVTALAVLPGGTTIYLGSANGGVFKSTNSGVNWTPVFDNGSVYSIGALAVQPGNPSIVYCGTGEANSAVDSYDGTGLYRTSDAGATWQHLGLLETRRIGRVAIDPLNPSRIFVAAMGPQFSTSPHRGLYRSEDGGANWTKVLFVNDSTGCADVAINPINPDTILAATWERVRHPTYRRAFGPGCGIWRSVDGGDTWTRLTNGLPVPSDDVGRIGLAMAPNNPSVIYAQIITGSISGYQGLGLYRTLNSGTTWTRRDASGFTGIFGGFGWYFGEVAVDPNSANTVYALGVDIARSTDGGVNFLNVRAGAHVDEHALWIDPANSQHIYMGSDGGFFWTTNGGTSWSTSDDLPITQFYAGTIDPTNPDRLMGGTQDNNTLTTGGPPSSWFAILGGDGFQCLIDPVDPNVVFAEYQFGCYGSGPLRSPDGGNNWDFPFGIDSGDRFNWNTPFAMNPLNHNTLVMGSHRLYRSNDNGFSYSVISPDLTTNNTSSLLVYSTLTTVHIAKDDTLRYYTGSDDGKVYRSTNGGGNWTDVTAGLPLRWVTRVTTDPADADIVYATLSGFGSDEHAPHVYRSTNSGGTWTSISGNLPNAPVNDLIVDPLNPSRLFIGTDYGVWVTNDLGAYWYPLGVGMPLQTTFDLTLHESSRTLVAATHGRSQWKLDLDDLPVAVTPGAPAPRLSLSAPAPNPTRAGVRFELDLSDRANTQVDLFDAAGRRVAALFRGHLPAGRHTIRWDGRDRSGREAAAATYYARASVEGRSAGIQRVIKLR